MAGKFEVATIFKAIDRTSRPVSRMQDRFNRFSTSAEKGIRKVSRATDKLNANIANAGKVTIAAGAAMGAALTRTSMVGAQFEKTMVSAAIKFPEQIRKGTEAFDQLQIAAMNIGETTEFSAAQAAGALEFLAMAGFSSKQAIGALPGVVDLATAANMDLARATDIATDTMGAFGLTSKDAAQNAANLSRVNDVLISTTTSANVTMEQLFQSVKTAGPVAKSAGSDIETLSAMLGVMANAGIKAEQGGTAAKNMFLNLSAPTAKAAQILQRIGVATKTATGDMRDMPDIIDDLRKQTSGLADAQVTAVFEQIFGREGLAGALAVVEAGGDSLRDFRGDLRNSSGAAKDMASVIRDTLSGSYAGFTAAIESVTIKLSELTKGPMRDAIDSVTQFIRTNADAFVNKVASAVKWLTENWETLLKTATRIAKVVAIIYAIGTALKLVQGILVAINLIAAANPFVLMALAVAAAVAAIYVAWEPVKAFFFNLWDAITGYFENSIAGITSTISSITSGISNLLGLDDEDESEVATDRRRGVNRAGMIHSPQERVSRSISESRSTDTTEVVVKDETGRAEVNGGRRSQRNGTLRVAQTGDFFIP